MTGHFLKSATDVSRSLANGEVPKWDSATRMFVGHNASTIGTVTSVDCTIVSPFSVTGVPITGSGTIVIGCAAQSGNKVYSSPANGASGTPAFRVLVTADLPFTRGTAVLVAGTVQVLTAAVTANSLIFLTTQVLGGVAGALYISARNAGVSFDITSTSVADTSTVGYVLFEP